MPRTERFGLTADGDTKLSEFMDDRVCMAYSFLMRISNFSAERFSALGASLNRLSDSAEELFFRVYEKVRTDVHEFLYRIPLRDLD
jgi:hypothetical protein